MATGDKSISYNDCAAQLFFTILLGATEFFLLAAMSYDCFVAICKPLNYMAIVSSRACRLRLFASWLVSGFLIIFPPLLMGLQLDFCVANMIDHFFCDVSPILQLSCTDTDITELLMLLSAILTFLITLLLVIFSYTDIIRTIVRIPSSQQRKKAFSTCSSHIVVVSISYGSCIFMYVKPSHSPVSAQLHHTTPEGIKPARGAEETNRTSHTSETQKEGNTASSSPHLHSKEVHLARAEFLESNGKCGNCC
ncbi:Olfactory receptor 6C74 [Heterocephalus glaber]|uniref:Olfactory receptor 6C74 n=1 Tax=Heterocephalus glaber TaxID=10181 RepID=G5AU85_HETGA|nr:Olfactory receptor 6C74 [Heterocephalus glaber]